MRPRVLLYRTLGLGDFLTAVPAYRAVAQAHPEALVVLAAPAPLRPLARLCGAVDAFVPTSELDRPRWAGPPPDLVVNLHGRGPLSHRTLLPLHSRRLFAFGNRDAGVTGPDWHPEEHEVTRWCRMLASFGVPSEPRDLVLQRPPSTRPGRTVLHPGAAAARRRWPAERFAALADALRRRGHDVVVTGTEVALTARVAAGGRLPSAANLGGHLDLGDLAALVAHARLVVCGDTGMAHLATAFRTPSVVLFGAMSPALWGPPADGPHVALWHGDTTPGVTGRPDPGLLDIGVAEVLHSCRVLTPQRPSH